MDELKPCPFGCSGHQVAIIPTGFGTWNVRCEECYIDGPESDTKMLAAKAWNTRPETSTGWISVEKSLPSMDSFVLAEFGKQMSVVSYCENGFLAWEDAYEEFNVPCKPTHWMPLPDPPYPETSTPTPKCGQSEATANLTQEAHSNIGDVTVTFPTNDDIEKAFGEWYVKKINSISPSNTWDAAIEWYKTSPHMNKCEQVCSEEGE